jgi:hypothetical protein
MKSETGQWFLCRTCEPGYLEGQDEENQPALAVTKSIFIKVGEHSHPLHRNVVFIIKKKKLYFGEMIEKGGILRPGLKFHSQLSESKRLCHQIRIA